MVSTQVERVLDASVVAFSGAGALASGSAVVAAAGASHAHEVEQTLLVPLQSASTAHSTQAPPAHLGMAAAMAAQVESLEPTATQVLAVTVEQTLVPVQSEVAAHATQAEPTHLGVAAEIAAQVASLEPTATQVL